MSEISIGSGVAKPGPTRAWAQASASGNSSTSYFRSIAICNDAVSYALLTSLFTCLALNTSEDLYCAHICRSHGSELVPIQDRRHFKHRLKNNLPLRCKKFTRGACPQHHPARPNQKNKQTKKNKRVQCWALSVTWLCH